MEWNEMGIKGWHNLGGGIGIDCGEETSISLSGSPSIGTEQW